MRKIIASLDIGTCEIKLIVGEIVKDKVNILSCINVPSQGIKKGFIVNPESATLAIKEAFDKTEEMIGLPVKKVIVTVPTYNMECFMTSGTTTITSENKVITHQDIVNAMHASVYKKISDNKELISILPAKYMINDEELISNPINMVANKLSIKDVAVLVPKKNAENITKVLEKLGIEIIDLCISPLADYHAYKDNYMEKSIGAIVNVGQSKTTVSIFNKGILTAAEVLDMGSGNIDNDIAYVFKINKKDSNYIKEKLVVCDIHVAQPSENVTLKDINDEEIKINQYDASAVAISRLKELFDLVKKQINLLTKKEISYIIVSGGISEISYINSFLEEQFSVKAVAGNITEIGARNNKYSEAIGMIKYYNSRLKLRNADYSIFNIDEEEELGETQRRVNISENSLLGKVFGYFFDN